MKATQFLIFLLAVCVGMPVLPAQEEQAKPAVTLTAFVQSQKARSTKLSRLRLVPPPTVTKGQFAYMTPENEMTTASVKECKVFVVETPADLAKALRDYAGDHLKEARKQLTAVRNKYAPFAGLPNDPATRAALTELSCDARLLDWKSLGKAVQGFPSPKFLEQEERAVLEAARILSMVEEGPDKAADRLKEAEALLADPAKSALLNSEAYSWVKYAVGRALADAITAEELNGTITKEHEVAASKAVDAYCEAAAVTHGRRMEVALDGLQRAFHLLWAMPGVKDYAGKGKEMDKKRWKAAPANFTDAVALAYMLQNNYGLETKDGDIAAAASLFYNTMPDKKRPAAAKH